MPPLTPQPQEESHKTLWVVGIAVAVLLLVGLGVFALLLRNPGAGPQGGGTTNTPAGGGSNTTEVPVTGGGGGGSTTQQPIATVGSQDNGTVAIHDFKNRPGTEADPSNPGLYYLAGGVQPSSATTPYSIFYLDASQSFNITLLQEPLAEVRLAAEQELGDILGASEVDMCRLRYWVGVPDSVNTLYSGTNLGFSFCPGATPL